MGAQNVISLFSCVNGTAVVTATRKERDSIIKLKNHQTIPNATTKIDASSLPRINDKSSTININT